MHNLVKVAKEGRICIPKQLRDTLKWEVGTKLKVTEINGKVVLEKAEKLCKMCGASEKIIPEMQICQYCVSLIKEIDLSDK